MAIFTTPQGEFDLARFPVHPRESLRAWDAADEYLLRQLDESGVGGPPVVLNDRWGALATALAEHGPTLISDSHLAQAATSANLARNDIAPDAVHLLSSTDAPPERVDLLLVRIPKSLALLEDQLHRIAPSIRPDTLVIGAGMVKEIHTSTLELFEATLGPTKTSLAAKKARLIFCVPDPELVRPANPWPRTYPLPDDLGALAGLPVTSHAGVFSAERLDLGTRLLLQHLPARSGPDRVVDLGCGNGIVGLAAALANPAAELTFIDESHLAVASARETFRANIGTGQAATFVVGHCLFSPADSTPIESGSVDLILNNPPFHIHHSLTDQAAWQMFADSRKALRTGGELWVVGNRHLGYHAKLKRLFGNCEVAASNAKFVVLRAVRS
jgi:23S rRNA (guanine1835-N2)-methyltransferase